MSKIINSHLHSNRHKSTLDMIQSIDISNRDWSIEMDNYIFF